MVVISIFEDTAVGNRILWNQKQATEEIISPQEAQDVES